jgi:hypothetical protein
MISRSAALLNLMFTDTDLQHLKPPTPRASTQVAHVAITQIQASLVVNLFSPLCLNRHPNFEQQKAATLFEVLVTANGM